MFPFPVYLYSLQEISTRYSYQRIAKLIYGKIDFNKHIVNIVRIILLSVANSLSWFKTISAMTSICYWGESQLWKSIKRFQVPAKCFNKFHFLIWKCFLFGRKNQNKKVYFCQKYVFFLILGCVVQSWFNINPGFSKNYSSNCFSKASRTLDENSAALLSPRRI